MLFLHLAVDCALNLLSLSPFEYKVMEVYIKEALSSAPMNSAFECLQQAKIFIKLDLCSACNLIRIRTGDEWVTTFITPAGRYE